MKKLIILVLSIMGLLVSNLSLAADCFCNGISCVQHQDPQKSCPDPQACGAGCIAPSADGTGRQ